MTQADVLKIFKALSVESRLQIVKLLKQNRLCVNAITKKLNITQPAVSQHLAVLKDAGLVKSDRYGTIIHYELEKARFKAFQQSVKKLLGDELFS